MGKKKAAKSTAKKISIEDAMEELQDIVDGLESGQDSLDDSLSRYERGMHLLRECHQQLDSAAQRIEIVTGIESDGGVMTQPFDTTTTEAKVSAKASSQELNDVDEKPDGLF